MTFNKNPVGNGIYEQAGLKDGANGKKRRSPVSDTARKKYDIGYEEGRRRKHKRDCGGL